MDLESFHELGNDLYHRLHLPTYPVAIKFIKKEDEIPKEAIRPSAGGQKWSLCQAFTYARRMGLHSAMTDDDNFCVPSIVLRGSACSVRYIGPPPRGTIMLPFTGVVIDCNRRQRMTAQMGIRVNAETVKAWVLSRGVDLVGIADADNLLLSYPPRPAAALMPSAKSVITAVATEALSVLGNGPPVPTRTTCRLPSVSMSAPARFSFNCFLKPLSTSLSQAVREITRNSTMSRYTIFFISKGFSNKDSSKGRSLILLKLHFGEVFVNKIFNVR